MCWLSTDYPRNACTDAAAAGGFHFDGENTAGARIDREEGDVANSARASRGPFGSWKPWAPAGLSICLTLNASPSLRTTSFQSQPRRTALWAVGTRTGAKYFAGGLEILFRTPG